MHAMFCGGPPKQEYSISVCLVKPLNPIFELLTYLDLMWTHKVLEALQKADTASSDWLGLD